MLATSAHLIPENVPIQEEREECLRTTMGPGHGRAAAMLLSSVSSSCRNLVSPAFPRNKSLSKRKLKVSFDDKCLLTKPPKSKASGVDNRQATRSILDAIRNLAKAQEIKQATIKSDKELVRARLESRCPIGTFAFLSDLRNL